jgi:hypothetical protein
MRSIIGYRLRRSARGLLRTLRQIPSTSLYAVKRITGSSLRFWRLETAKSVGDGISTPFNHLETAQVTSSSHRASTGCTVPRTSTTPA